MLISDKYREQQQKLHEMAYGVSGGKYAKEVANAGLPDILDYGCGKRMLEKALGFKIHNYDPCIEGLEENNTPHDFVYCGDVLEHIEPDCLDYVLADIRRCMKVKGLLVISTVKASKTLSDGRNAHLIIKPADWWRERLVEYFTITKEEVKPDEYLAWVSVIRS